MKVGDFDVGVCSWSLRPASADQLVKLLRKLGLEHAQLALGPLIDLDPDAQQAELEILKHAEIKVTAGMIHFPGEDYSSISHIRRTGGLVPDTAWPERRKRAVEAGRLAQKIGLSQISTHIGFIPPSNNDAYSTLIERVGDLGEQFQEFGIELLLETGQENATDLLHFLHDLKIQNIGVNFDPANMILYGSGDPIDAMKTLARHIKHVHVKDARRSSQPGIEWGTETPFGEGEVPHEEFIDTLHRIDYTGPLVIERESGKCQLEDIHYAIETLEKAMG